MAPVNKLLYVRKYFRLTKFPISEGRLPLNRFVLKYNVEDRVKKIRSRINKKAFSTFIPDSKVLKRC